MIGFLSLRVKSLPCWWAPRFYDSSNLISFSNQNIPGHSFHIQHIQVYISYQCTASRNRHNSSLLGYAVCCNDRTGREPENVPSFLDLRVSGILANQLDCFANIFLCSEGGKGVVDMLRNRVVVLDTVRFLVVLMSTQIRRRCCTLRDFWGGIQYVYVLLRYQHLGVFGCFTMIYTEIVSLVDIQHLDCFGRDSEM